MKHFYLVPWSVGFECRTEKPVGLSIDVVEYKFMSKATDIIKQLQYGTGDFKCFCDVAIGNPMYREHSRACIETTEFLKSIE